MTEIAWVTSGTWDVGELTQRRLSAALSSLKGPKVLDIGCRDGTFILTAACEHPDWQFVGIDINKSDLEWAQNKAAELRLENVLFYHADLTSTTAMETMGTIVGKFDTVVFMETLEHFEPRIGQAVYERVIRFLAPEGRLLMCVPANTHISDPDHKTVFYREQIHKTVKEIHWVYACPFQWLMWWTVYP